MIQILRPLMPKAVAVAPREALDLERVRAGVRARSAPCRISSRRWRASAAVRAASPPMPKRLSEMPPKIGLLMNIWPSVEPAAGGAQRLDDQRHLQHAESGSRRIPRAARRRTVRHRRSPARSRRGMPCGRRGRASSRARSARRPASRSRPCSLCSSVRRKSIGCPSSVVRQQTRAAPRARARSRPGSAAARSRRRRGGRRRASAPVRGAASGAPSASGRNVSTTEPTPRIADWAG